MAKERIFFELTKTYSGCYSVEVPDDATWDQRMEIFDRERKRWPINDPDADAADALLDHAGSYSETYDDLEMGWE